MIKKKAAENAITAIYSPQKTHANMIRTLRGGREKRERERKRKEKHPTPPTSRKREESASTTKSAPPPVAL